MAVLNCVDNKGRGQPALAFVHGMNGSTKAWAAQMDAWPQLRCVAIDLPGHGKSGPIADPTVANVARAVNGTLDALGLNDVVLVGHSMGCRITAEMFTQSPHRFRAMVFVDGSLAEGDPDANLQRWEPYIQETEQAALAKGRDVPTRRKMWHDFVHWDARRSAAALRTIDVPVLLLQSTITDENRNRRRIQPGEVTPWAALMAASAKGEVIVEHIADSGHFIMRDATARHNELITAFVRRTVPR